MRQPKPTQPSHLNGKPSGRKNRKPARRQALAWSAVMAAPLVAALWSQASLEAAPALGKLQYNRDVRPILAENCFACHGPDSAARKANLRLDRAADAMQVTSGRAAIVKGNPGASEFIKRILGNGPLMPPKASHKTLTKVQIDVLKRWVAQGAEYEEHWAYIPPRRPSLPVVKNGAWAKNPIDRFVLARLEAAGIKPAAEADRRTLARRLSFDLLGLPPEPADVEAFVNDKSPNAYEKFVDKLMASPQWGEHRGRYWLDAARYADTHGIHFDNFREVWAYRDWVIQAFNKNMPFDQFTVEQLAGDLLPNPTLDQLVASGFNRQNITTNEGGVIQEEYLVLYTRDRTETASQVWLGTTTGCAVCHDHKFDPVSQKEFYSLAAFFNNSTQGAMDGNIKDTPPIIPVPMSEDRERFTQVQAELKTVRTQADARKQTARAEFETWVKSPDAAAVSAKVPSKDLSLHLPLSEGQGREISGTLNGEPIKATLTADAGWTNGYVGAKAYTRQNNSTLEVPGAGDWDTNQPFTVSAWLWIPNVNTSGAAVARLDDGNDFRGWDLWLEGGKVGTHIINKWPESALKVISRTQLKARQWQHVTISYNGAGNPGGVKIFIDGAAQPTDTANDTLKGTVRTTVPLKLTQRHTSSPVNGVALQDLRLYNRSLSDADATLLARGTRAVWLVGRGSALSTPEKDELFNWWLPGQDEQYRILTTKVAALEGEERAIRFRGTIAHVSNEKAGDAMAFILFRGDYDKRRDPVKAETPAFLPTFPTDQPKNRLGLARWLLQPDQPLTTRVTVNRFWQEVFGQGLVRTAGDFGIAGEQPSHPELLDWMAMEFREGGWDIKKFFKLMVTSATYRQAATVTPEKRVKDASNRLMSRGPRFRMDAEMVRDSALAASGLLVKKLGGPSVKPYQPDGVWEAVAMIGSNTRDYKRDTGENLYRRSMYTFWKRSAPPASLDIFNAPNRETCAVRRERTNTPLQALVTLNDVQFVEAARHLATRTLKEGGATDEARIDYMARLLLARSFRPEELAVVKRSLMDLMGHYQGNEKDAKALITMGDSKPDATLEPQRLAAWTMLANQLMNLDEVLSK